MTQLEIRWLVRKPPEPSVSEVKELQAEYGIGALAAKKALITARGGKTRTLQVLHDGCWVDVPEETEELPNVPFSEDIITAAVYKEMHL